MNYKDILEECMSIAQARQESYGAAQDSLQTVSNILKEVFNLNFSPSDVCKVLIALKLARMKNGFHEDSAKDLINYTAILISLQHDKS